MLYIKLNDGSERRIDLGDIAKERGLAKRFQLKEVSPDKALTLRLASGTSEHIYVRDIAHMSVEEKAKPRLSERNPMDIIKDIVDGKY